MSKYDKEYQDYVEEEYLNQYISDEMENNEGLEEIINENFDRNKIYKYTSNENKDYLNFIFDKIKKEDEEKGTNNYEQKNNYLNLIKNTYFQKQHSKSEKINYLIYYLKNKYSILTGNILYSLFNNDNEKKNENESNMSVNDYKNFILMNFNKETINLDNEEDYKKFSKLLFDIVD